MTKKLLTIIIPTFNRADCLDLLLRTLKVELAGLEGIQVVVADNASSDHTQEVTARFKVDYPAALVVRRQENIGADENFCRCIEATDSRYFWLLGDDDLPKESFIRRLVPLLDKESPDLLSVGSEWVEEITSASQGKPLGDLRYRMLDQRSFAREVNVWMTFISGIVINRETLLAELPLSVIRCWSGSNIVQLGWVFGQLASGKRFIRVLNRCVLATAANTGGYAVMKIFGENFPHITEQSFGSTSVVTNNILQRSLIGYLPGLAWKVRFANIGNFLQEDSWLLIRRRLGRFPLFWFTVFPIMRFSKPLAWPFYILSRALAAGARIRDGR